MSIEFAQTKLNIGIIGDTQRTLPIETTLLFREQNDEERVFIMNDLAQQKIDLLIHLGDLVESSKPAHWDYFEKLIAPIRAAQTPIYPVIGNHDLMGKKQLIAEHFPVVQTHWYSGKYANLRFLFLDLNHRVISKKLWEEQKRWFENSINEAEKDPSIQAILVFGHQPPFTNSKVTHDDKKTKKELVPIFLKSQKTVAWFGGHSHSFEHFFEGGKHFIVSGGGGGPRVKLHEGKHERHHDLVKMPAPRPFHYLLMKPSEYKIDITVRGLQKGSTQIANIDSFSIEFRK